MSFPTPGPWSIDARWPASIKDANGMVVVANPTGPSKSAEENYANARLIAAAPDLYRIVSALSDWFGEGDAAVGGSSMIFDDDETLHGALIAAVAKVRGS